MKTNAFQKTLAIFMSILLAMPLFILPTFAEDYAQLSVYTDSLNEGDFWYNCRALATATGTEVYRYNSTFYLSEDQDTIKIEYTVDETPTTELHTRSEDPQYFEYLRVMPAFGTALPTSPDGLQDGDYWFNVEGLVSFYSTYYSESTLNTMFRNATYYLSVDGTILRRTYTMYGYQSNSDELIVEEPGTMAAYLMQVGYDPNAGFTLLAKSADGVQGGDYWFDVASFVSMYGSEYASYYENADYYLSDDTNTIRVYLQGSSSPMEWTREGESVFFTFLKQVGVDPNAGFTLLPTTDTGLQDGDYWYDVDALIAAIGNEESIRAAQFYLSDDGNTLRIVLSNTPHDYSRNSQEGTVYFGFLRQVGVDPNLIPGFTLLPTSDEGLQDGDYWYDAAGLAEFINDENALTCLYYLSDDGNTLRIKLDAGTVDVSRTDEHAGTYFGFLRQVGVDSDQIEGFTLLPKSADNLETGDYWYDAAGFAAMANDDSYLRWKYYLSDDGNTLRIVMSGYSTDITKNSSAAVSYFIYLHKVGESYTVLPTSADGLEDGAYWFDAAGLAAATQEDSFLSATYSLRDDGEVLRVTSGEETQYYMNVAEYTLFFQYLRQAGVDPNAGFTALPISADGLGFGAYWYDAASLSTTIGDPSLAEAEYYLSTDHNTLRVLLSGQTFDFPADDEESAFMLSFLKIITTDPDTGVSFMHLPHSADGLSYGAYWYDAAGLSSGIGEPRLANAVYFLSEDHNTLRVLFLGETFDFPADDEESAYMFSFLQKVEDNFGFTPLPTSADDLEEGAYWYDLAGYAAYIDDASYLNAQVYLSNDGETLRIVLNDAVMDFPKKKENSELYFGYLHQVGEEIVDPNAGFTLLPTTDEGLADGDYWFDTANLSVLAGDTFATAQYYLSEDGNTLRILSGEQTADVTRENEEGSLFFNYLRQVGVNPNEGFAPLPTASAGLDAGDYWYDAASLAVTEGAAMLDAEYFISEDGSTVRIVYYGMPVDYTADSEEGNIVFACLHQIGAETDTVCLTMNAPTEAVLAGNTVVVTVDLTQNPGIAGMSLSLLYDAEAMTLTDVESLGLFEAGNLVIGGDLTAVPFNILWDDAVNTENHTETGSVLKLTFTVKDNTPAGKTAVTMTYDAAGTFDVALEDAAMTIYGTSILITNRLPGDANEDGTVDLKDVTALTRYLAGGWDVTVNESNCDVNADGILDLKDVVLIRRYLAGGWNAALI